MTVLRKRIAGGLGLAAIALSAPTLALATDKAPTNPFSPVLVAESRSKSLCESDPDRIFVRSEAGSECIAYFATGNSDDRRAVIFFDGDAAAETAGDTDLRESELEKKHKFIGQWAKKMNARYIYVSRVGLNGSSGNHGLRRRPHETVVMDAAIDALKKRLGFDSIVLAGQSGGSTIAASLLTRGRDDVVCAVLGSGAYELVELEYRRAVKNGYRTTRTAVAKTMYDPSDHVDEIVEDPDRRILILGDLADKRTPADQQQRFAATIAEHGHHARFVEIDATGENDHSAIMATIPAAGACMRGDSDQKIARALEPKKVKTASKRED